MVVMRKGPKKFGHRSKDNIQGRCGYQLGSSRQLDVKIKEVKVNVHGHWIRKDRQ